MSAQLGAVAAAYALEHLGGQSHAYTPASSRERFGVSFGSSGRTRLSKIVAACSQSPGLTGDFRSTSRRNAACTAARRGGVVKRALPFFLAGRVWRSRWCPRSSRPSSEGAPQPARPSGGAGGGLPQQRQPGPVERHGHRPEQTVRQGTYGYRFLGLRRRRRSSRCSSSRPPKRPLDLIVLLDTQLEHVGQDGRRARGGDRLPQDAAGRRSRRGRHVRRRRRRRPAADRRPSRQLEQAIRRTTARGATSLHNAIYIALKTSAVARSTTAMSGVRRLRCCRTERIRRAS